jgi:phosphoglycerate dehydrogenase-like enzyme
VTPFRVGISPDVLDSRGAPIFDPAALDLLNVPGLEWRYLTAEEERTIAPPTAAAFDAVCLMLGRVTRETFAQGGGRLKLVARFGVGFDTIDVPACTEHGALLTIAPDGVRRPVAVNVITFVLVLAQRLFVKDRITREGRWAEKVNYMGMGLTGRTLGAIGMGNIGAEVFRLAAPFGMRHLACDPYVSADQARALGAELVDLDTLLARADFVCVMCPLNDETRGLIGARELALMKPTAYLINTARGPIVQENALYEALAARRIAGAGLDVFEVEPTPADNPILRLDSVVVTPHAFCFTDECLTGLARSAFTSVVDVAQGRAPRYIVNRAALAHPRLVHLAARDATA